MYQHLDLMAAQSMAREREHELQADLRQRQGAAGRAPEAEPDPLAGHHWIHDLLVRVHLAHAPVH